jgi:superoxide dismutase, Fe-Mn family
MMERRIDEGRTGGVARRHFLRALGIGSAAAAFAVTGAGRSPRSVQAAPLPPKVQTRTAPVDGTHRLPPLPYAYNALEPHIDELTMFIHHTRHHQSFVNTLNTTLANYPDLRNRDATDLISNLDAIPEAIRTTVRNNGGGHVNHSIFWAIMGPNGGGEPRGEIAQAINATFGNFGELRAAMNGAGLGRFGSGWVWLVLNRDRTLAITTTANQDSPYMVGQVPLFGIDVWEHAYYLRYQNRRADYLAAWWNTINWHAVEQRYIGSR